METVLIGGTLIDGTGREPVPGAGVVVKDGKVHAAGPTGRLSYGRDARVIDVAGLTIMPGLIDTHTHLTYHGDQPNVWQLEFEESVELNTLKAARNAGYEPVGTPRRKPTWSHIEDHRRAWRSWGQWSFHRIGGCRH